MSDTVRPQVGKRYVTRDGRVTAPIELTCTESFPFQARLPHQCGGGVLTWYSSGRYRSKLMKHPLDLVSEAPDEASSITGDAQAPSPITDAGAASDKAGDGWIEWHGGECPVAPRTLVGVRRRGGDLREMGHALGWSWSHDGDDLDIIAYRIVQPAAPEALPDVAALQKELDYWRGQAQRLAADGDPQALRERIAQLKDAVRLILPLAKGYVAANRVGANQQKIETAEAALADTPTAPASEERERLPNLTPLQLAVFQAVLTSRLTNGARFDAAMRDAFDRASVNRAGLVSDAGRAALQEQEE